MDQISFSEAEYTVKKRQTRREKFLEQMDGLIPWKRWEKKLARHDAQPGHGRRPYSLSVMLRVHCIQLFYNLSDPAMADALYESESMRRFAGRRLSGPLPDETTILKCRHFLEKHPLGKVILKEVNRHLEKEGLLLREGTVVDATIISAPTSTKNQSGRRDPHMHQTKKGNEWHVGMKMHMGVDETLGVIPSLETTPAHVHDMTQTETLRHGKEKTCWGDAGDQGVDKRDALADSDIDWEIAVRPGKRKTLNQREQRLGHTKAQVRAKVEHPLRIIKRPFGYSTVRYRRLAKNNNRLQVLSAFANRLRCKHMLPS